MPQSNKLRKYNQLKFNLFVIKILFEELYHKNILIDKNILFVFIAQFNFLNYENQKIIDLMKIFRTC